MNKKSIESELLSISIRLRAIRLSNSVPDNSAFYAFILSAHADVQLALNRLCDIEEDAED